MMKLTALNCQRTELSVHRELSQIHWAGGFDGDSRNAKKLGNKTKFATCESSIISSTKTLCIIEKMIHNPLAEVSKISFTFQNSYVIEQDNHGSKLRSEGR